MIYRLVQTQVLERRKIRSWLCQSALWECHIVRSSDCKIVRLLWRFSLRGCQLVSRDTKGQVCLRCLPKFGNKITSDVPALFEKETYFYRNFNSSFEILCTLKFSWNWVLVSKKHEKHLTYFVTSCENLTFNLDFRTNIYTIIIIYGQKYTKSWP